MQTPHNNLRLAQSAAGIVAAFTVGAAGAATFHVNASALPGGDGLSWSTAFDTIDAAIAAADANGGSDDIWVVAGVYRAPLTVWSLSDVRLFGGFAGFETSLFERNLAASETVLTGDQLGDDVPIDINQISGGIIGLVPPPQFADNVPQILSLNFATLDGVTVTGVNTSALGAACVASDSTIRSCLFRDNFGGALFSLGNNIVSKSTFVRSATSTAGAAIAQVTPGFGFQPVRVYNCRFHQNYSVAGGAVAAITHGVLLANCVFTGNIAALGGAGVHVAQQFAGPGVTVDIINCTIVRNQRLIPLGGPTGVGVHTQALLAPSQVRVRNSIITENTLFGSAAAGIGVFDIARASTGTGGVVQHLVERCLATVSSSISVSAPVNPQGAPVPSPGFEALTGEDGILGTMDDEPRLVPRGTPCIDRAQFVSLPADEADLDDDGDTSEPLPIDINGQPRVFDDPEVLGPTGGTLDAGAAELQSNTGLLLTSASITQIDPAGDGFIRLLTPGASTLVNQQPTGVATVFLFESALPAAVITTNLTLDRVALSTPGDIWVGDTAGNEGALRMANDLPLGTALIACRSLDFRRAAFRYERPVSMIASSGVRIRAGCLLGFRHDLDLLGQLTNEGGLTLERTVGIANRINITSGGFSQLVTGGPEDPSPVVTLWADVNGSNASLMCDGPLFLQGTLDLTIDGAPPDGPALGQSWTLLTGASRSGLFDTAFLPGWADRLTRLVYTSTSRSANVVAQVESRDNVVTLDPPLGFPVPGAPRAAAVGKVHAAAYLNPDLAVVVPNSVNPTTAPGTLHVLLNLGNTATSWNGYAAVTITKATDIDPSAVVIADLDGDTLNDIAVANRGSDSVRVFINNGADDFPGFIDIPTLDAPEGLAAADFDADGDIDLAVSGIDAPSPQGAVVVLLNTFGVFVPEPPISLGSNPTALITADLDNLNGPDLAVADTGDDRVAVFFNKGTDLRAWLSFRTALFIIADDEPSSIQPGNIDNGKDDTLVSSNTGPNANSVTIIRPGPSGPEIDGYTSITGPIGDAPRSLTLIDINNDGLDDIVAVASPPGSSLRTLRVLVAEVDAGGNVQFTQAPDIATPTEPSIVLTADLDGDGSDDIVTVGPDGVSNRGGGGAEVKASLGPPANNIAAVLTRPPCRGDFNNDAAVTTSDLTFFLGRFGQTATPGTPAFRADFNSDGVVNTADLVTFLGRFGRPCP
ncbi:MAG: FG-GAP-like repeat-containing protein [Phycisphaerales bacterium]